MIVERCKIEKQNDYWSVPSQSKNMRYVVCLGAEPHLPGFRVAVARIFSR